MKVKYTKNRDVIMPLAGIEFEPDELRQSKEMAAVLANFPPEVLASLVDALAHEAIRLERAAEWTGTQSAINNDRRARLATTRLTYRAAVMAQGM